MKSGSINRNKERTILSSYGPGALFLE